MCDGRPSQSSLPISLFDYDLPEELIAQHPLDDRSASRMLVLERQTERITHTSFQRIPDWLKAGDLLVLNDTRVFPARVLAQRSSGGRIEILLLQHLSGDEWQAMARPARRLREGETLYVLDKNERLIDLAVTFLSRLDDGTVTLEVPHSAELLDRAGRIPLPGYITSALDDPERYQTVYAREAGSVAAPTAGLHFTEELLERLRSNGVRTAWVTLHVGPGTFQPVREDDALRHRMHEERYSVSEEAKREIQAARAEKRRIIAVGTTSCRTLESVADRLDDPGPLTGETALYITPGYSFDVVDALLTNFHLPKSTLLLLVSALAGRELVLRSYAEAIRERYRFYSFGDAMLIL